MANGEIVKVACSACGVGRELAADDVSRLSVCPSCAGNANWKIIERKSAPAARSEPQQ